MRSSPKSGLPVTETPVARWSLGLRYLFDTDTLSQLLRRSPTPTLLRRLAATPVDEQAISSVTVGELLYGAHRLRERAGDLAERIERTLIANLGGQAISATTSARAVAASARRRCPDSSKCSQSAGGP